MKFTLNNFYSNNYKDFIHLEALKNILRKVPELNLAGLENIENVLSMEFSVDDWGENPMYITYSDTDGKEHIVKIRPAVTDQIYEILKAYAKISYVDEQDKKLKDELHTEITQGDENTLNLSKAYTDTVVNHAKDEINHTIETTKQELKNYCDNKCEITLASSKEYTDTQLEGYETKADAKAEHDKLSTEVENANKVYGYNTIADTWEKCNGNFTVSYNNSNITKLGYRQTNGEVEKGVDFTKLATNDKVETINQLVTANDNKTTQALADVNGNVSSILTWKEIVDSALERKKWRMFEVRPEEYTPLNGATIDRERSYTRFFQFDNYALFIADIAINHLTMNTWTYKELVSFPKAYLEHFSHFQHFTNTILTADGLLLYSAGLDFDKANLTIYSRGTAINDAYISLLVGGILYD